MVLYSNHNERGYVKLSISEYAANMRVSRQRVWCLVKEGRIRAERFIVGGKAYYRIEEDSPYPEPRRKAK